MTKPKFANRKVDQRFMIRNSSTVSRSNDNVIAVAGGFFAHDDEEEDNNEENKDESRTVIAYYLCVCKYLVFNSADCKTRT